MTAALIVQGVYLGVLATIAMDLWALTLNSTLKIPTTNWAMVGRWLAHLPRGQFVQHAIADVAPVGGERALGWFTHYAIGVVYGVGYLYFIDRVEGITPSLSSAIIFSLAMIVAPWFILQPGLGLGLFASRSPRPWRSRALTVSMHTVFGFGLYLGWLWSWR